jgi:hypothetical protein
MLEFDGQSEAEGQPSGELFDLLTDALRAGPDSQQWLEATQRLRAAPDADEYKLLLEARQRLESGKAFRAITGSRQLAEAVMASVAAESVNLPRRLPARTLVRIAALAAVVILSVSGVVITLMLGDGGVRSQQTVYIPHTAPPRLATLAGFQSFENAMPVGWNMIGTLRVKADHGLHLAKGPKQLDQFGGLIWQDPLAASRPFKLEARIRFLGAAGVAPEVFLTDQAAIDDEKPIESSHEFVWTVMNDRPSVRRADESLASAGQPIAAGDLASLEVEIKVNGSSAVVETERSGVCTHWTGVHLLDGDKPWRMGVRFVVHGDRHDDCVTVDAIRLTQR